MREIKFRVWDKDNSQMYYQTEDFKDLALINGQFKPVLNNLINNSFNWYRRNYELMQYTGLKDKNGTEIYEGDIVTYSVKGFKKINKTVMTFNEEHGAYLFGIYEGVKMPCGKKTRMNKYTRKSVNNVGVIGNIYQNPELLEGVDND